MTWTFENANTASFAIIKVDLPFGTLENHGNFRAEYPAVVASITDAAVEAAPGFFHGLVDGERCFDFIEGVNPFIDGE